MDRHAQNCLPQQPIDRPVVRAWVMNVLRVTSIGVCLFTITSFSQLKPSAQQPTAAQLLNQQSTELTVQRYDLVNQKERIAKLEEEILDHDRTINRAIGLGMAFSGLLMILQGVQIIVSLRRPKV
jgi:hypothetical protein